MLNIANSLLDGKKPKINLSPLTQRKRHEIFYNFDSIEINGNKAKAIVILSGEIVGTPAYPFFISFGQNTFNLKKVDNKWVIYGHDYIDVYFYEQSKTEKITYDTTKLKQQIDEEYLNTFDILIDEDNETDSSILSYPHTDYNYSNNRAVTYANKFVTNGNTYFYSAGADCTNFVSQCVSYGFGNTTNYSTSTSYRMVSGSYSSGWFAGSGGGSGPWESVTNHWNYMVSSKTDQEGPRVSKTTWANLKNGGVMQIDFDSDGEYTHSVICVDKSNEKFAQHTSNTYRYYDDYGGTKRFYNPTCFRVYD